MDELTQDPSLIDAGVDPQPGLGKIAPVKWASSAPYVPSSVYTGGKKTWNPLSTDFAGDIIKRTLPRAIEGAARDSYNLINDLLGQPGRTIGNKESWVAMHTNLGELAGGLGEAALLAVGTAGIGAGANAATGGRSLAAMVGVPASIRTAVSEYSALHPIVTSFSRAAVQGATIDFIMSREGPGLSQMLQSLDSETAKKIGGILASGKEDSLLTKRIKGVLEGAGIGVALHPLAEMVVAWKRGHGFSMKGAVEHMAATENAAAAARTPERAVMVGSDGKPQYNTPPAVSRAFRLDQADKARSAAKMWVDLRSLMDPEQDAHVRAYERFQRNAAAMDDYAAGLEASLYPNEGGFPRDILDNGRDPNVIYAGPPAERLLLNPGRTRAAANDMLPSALREAGRSLPPVPEGVTPIHESISTDAMLPVERKMYGVADPAPRVERGLEAMPMQEPMNTRGVKRFTEGTALGEAQSVGTGPQAFVEASVAQGASRAVMERFAARMKSLEGVKVYSAEGTGGAAITGLNGEKAILLGKRALDGDLTPLHEAFHLADLSAEERATIQADFDAAKAKGGQGYKFKNADEYFAVTGSVAALRKIGIELRAESGGLKGAIGKAQLWFDNFWGAIKDVIGVDRTRRIAESFLSGERHESVPATPAAPRVSFAEGAQASLNSVAEKLKSEFLNNNNLNPEVVPHRMTAAERIAQKTEKGDLTTKYMGSDPEQLLALRAIERAADDDGFVNSFVRSDEATQEFTNKIANEVAQMTGTTFEQVAHNLPDNIRKASAYLKMVRASAVDRAGQVAKLSNDFILNPSMENAAKFIYSLDRAKSFAADVRQGPSELGRATRELQLPVPKLEDEVLARLRDDPGLEALLKDPKAMADYVNRRGGIDSIQVHAESFQKDIEAGRTVAEQVKIAREISEALDAPTSAQLAAILFRRHLTFSLLTLGRTNASQIAMSAVQPGRHWMGAFLNRLFWSMKGDPAAIEQASREIAGAQKQYGHYFDMDTWTRSFRGARAAYEAGEGRILGRSDIVSATQGKLDFDFKNLDAWRRSKQLRAPDFMKPLWSENNPFYKIGEMIMTKGSSGKGADYAGKITYGSTRGLVASDEFVKGLVSDSLAPTLLEQEYFRQYPNNPGGMRDWVAQKMDILYHDGQLMTADRLQADGERVAVQAGAVTPEDIRRQGAEYAKRIQDANPDLLNVQAKLETRAHEAAGTIPMDDSAFGKMTKAVKNFTNEHGWPAWFLPFIDTSYSLAKTGAQHMDFVAGPLETLGLFKAYKGLENAPLRAEALQRARSQFAKDMLSGDPFRQAEATGRLALGFGASSFCFWLANQEDEDGLPYVTGALSRNKEIRQMQQAAGLIDYGVRIPGTKTFVSIQGIEPFGTPLGIGFDLGGYAKMNPQDPNGSSYVGATMVAFANNFTNKTFLTGFTTFMEAMNDQSAEKFYTWARQAGVATIPGVGLQALPQLAGSLERAQTGSSPQRDVRTWIDEVMKRDPFFGGRESLPLMRNVIGEPVEAKKYMAYGFMPFAYNEVSDNVVVKELRRLQFPFRPAPWRQDGVDLRDVENASGVQAWDRWGELSSQVVIGGKTLQQALRAAIQTPAYKALTEDEDAGGQNSKANYLNGIVTSYRTVAYKKMLPEFPTLNPRVAGNVIPASRQREALLRLAR